MTPVELNELAQDLAFEKWTLDESLLVMPDPIRDVIDLRGPSPIIGAHGASSLCGGAVAAFRDKVLLPLLFGTAWKVVDLIVERAWQSQGGPARPQIAQKVARTTSHPAEAMAVVCADQQLLDRILAMYRVTADLRHALIHRRITRGGDGELVAPNGTQLSRSEILALCMAVRRLPDTLGRSVDLRERSEFAWHLNQLQQVHGMPDLADAYKPRSIDIVKVAATDINGSWVVNATGAKEKAKRVNGGFPFADVQVFLPGQSEPVAECRLEDLPDGDQVSLQVILSHC